MSASTFSKNYFFRNTKKGATAGRKIVFFSKCEFFTLEYIRKDFAKKKHFEIGKYWQLLLEKSMWTVPVPGTEPWTDCSQEKVETFVFSSFVLFARKMSLELMDSLCPTWDSVVINIFLLPTFRFLPSFLWILPNLHWHLEEKEGKANTWAAPGRDQI